MSGWDEVPSWVTEHVALYRRDPEKAHMWDASLGAGKLFAPTLLLTTKGRKSGEPRTTPLIYGKWGKGFAVIASKAGHPTHPAWYLNIEVDPDVEIQVITAHHKARARVAGPEEREKIWAEMVKIFPVYNSYQKRTGGREIPVVVLEPVA